jgi:hypothetical protein
MMLAAMPYRFNCGSAAVVEVTASIYNIQILVKPAYRQLGNGRSEASDLLKLFQ